ncbi:LysR substrate-binding domain-containing protein [Zoogloea sp.]|uniref:LysR substrate-binding domain-containing protein n=1 Tax=Zoogloea sp. TaxID=49181 RepID=UPI0035B242E3
MQNTLRQLAFLAPLQGFEATARHLSFTLAASELCLTQSAISRQVQGLEAQLGVALFARHHRRLELTPAGERLLATVQDVFRQLSATVAAIRVDQRRPVTLSTTIGVAAMWLVPRLSRFLAEHPEVDVRISANNRLVDIEREGIDLALRYVPPEQQPATSHFLFGEDIFPVGAPSLVGELATRVPDADDFARLILLNYDDPSPDPWLDWTIWLKQLGVPDAKPKAVLHFNHYDQLIAAAVAGQGVALGRSVLITEHLASGRLQPLASPYRHASLRAYHLIEAATEPRPEVRLLADWLRAEALACRGATGA